MQEQSQGYRNGAAPADEVKAHSRPDTRNGQASPINEMRQRLEEPFPTAAVRWVVKATSKRGTRQGPVDQGLVLPYVDVRQYSDRLTEVIGLGGWTRRSAVQITQGSERRVRDGQQWKIVVMSKIVVSCEVTLSGLGTQTGLGESWAGDDNAVTAAEAQAFKRACSMFGLGRYLYDIEGEWVDLDERGWPLQTPSLPEWARPESERAAQSGARSGYRSLRNGNNLYRQELDGQMKQLCEVVGAGLAVSVLRSSAGVAEPGKIRDLTKVPLVIERLENAARGVRQLRDLVAKAGEESYRAACTGLGIPAELDAIPDLVTLSKLIEVLGGGNGRTVGEQASRATIIELRRRLLQEARRASQVTRRQLAELVAEASAREVTLDRLYKTTEQDRAGLEKAIRHLQALPGSE